MDCNCGATRVVCKKARRHPSPRFSLVEIERGDDRRFVRLILVSCLKLELELYRKKAMILQMIFGLDLHMVHLVLVAVLSGLVPSCGGGLCFAPLRYHVW